MINVGTQTETGLPRPSAT